MSIKDPKESGDFYKIMLLILLVKLYYYFEILRGLRQNTVDLFEYIIKFYVLMGWGYN